MFLRLLLVITPNLLLLISMVMQMLMVNVRSCSPVLPLEAPPAPPLGAPASGVAAGGDPDDGDGDDSSSHDTDFSAMKAQCQKDR